MSKLIKVPYIKQPKRSVKCGAACAAMLIKHYQGIKVDLDSIWEHISGISPERNRRYCSTFKIGAYISKEHFTCSTVRYRSLEELLKFCISHEIAPIVNHKSFEGDKTAGHFSVVKNLNNGVVFINDPENKKRTSVTLNDLGFMATKSDSTDEVGGNAAIIPVLDKFPTIIRSCPNCNSTIDISFSRAVNITGRVVDADLCQACDHFIPSV